MNESAIHISSVKREQIGTNKLHDFLVKFNPPLKIDPEFRHFIALDRSSMTYSWYNIRSSYGNNTIKYTHDGTTWHTITFTDGMYSDTNDYIHQYMDQRSHHSTGSKREKVFSINLTFILSTYQWYHLMVIINLIYVEQILETSSDLKRNWWLKQSMEHASLILRNQLTH